MFDFCENLRTLGNQQKIVHACCLCSKCVVAMVALGNLSVNFSELWLQVEQSGFIFSQSQGLLFQLASEVWVKHVRAVSPTSGDCNCQTRLKAWGLGLTSVHVKKVTPLEAYEEQCWFQWRQWPVTRAKMRISQELTRWRTKGHRVMANWQVQHEKYTYQHSCNTSWRHETLLPPTSSQMYVGGCWNLLFSIFETKFWTGTLEAFHFPTLKRQHLRTSQCSDPAAFGPGAGDLTNLIIKYTKPKAKHPGRPELTTAWPWSTKINKQRDFLCEKTHFATEQKFVEVT